MACYSASFVTCSVGVSDSFAQICRVTEALVTEWRNAVPARRRLGYAVHAYGESDWVRIDGTLQPETEQLLSEQLSADVLGVYAMDEFVLSFSLALFQAGRELRRVRQAEIDGDLVWNEVTGEPQPWEEAVFFPEESLASYLRLARSDRERRERARVFAGRRLVEGADIPWAADYQCLQRLSAEMRLPWMGREEPATASYAIAPLDQPRTFWRRLFGRR